MVLYIKILKHNDDNMINLFPTKYQRKIPTSLTSVKLNVDFNVPQLTQAQRNALAVKNVKNSGNSLIDKKIHPISPKPKSTPKNTNKSNSNVTSSGNGITSGQDAAEDSLSGEGGGGVDLGSDSGSDLGSGSGSDSGSSSTSGATSPLLEGSMTFEELIGEICNGIDLIFVCKRSTVVVSDYSSIYAEAKYLRDNYNSSVEAEDIALWQLEDGTYELEVSEYGFYNTVKVHYKNGVVTESYEDLVRVFGEVTKHYYEKKIDKTTAIMKAKAYLAAHVRDFDMSVKANLLHDADIDIGDIVTLENPMTMRDQYRKDKEKRDPEYFFVMGNSISWDGNGPILNSIELRYGAKSPNKKEVPEVGASYSGSSSSDNSDIDTAIEEVGKMAGRIKYSGACQTHDCVKDKQTGDCFGMSDFIACELESRGVSTKIKGYPTSYAPEHRSVLYQDSTGEWKRFPYRKYNVDYLFRDTNAVNSGHDVNKTC